MKFTLMIGLMITIVGLSLAGYSHQTSGDVLRNELQARGRSLAVNLAFNSKFGVLSEDAVTLGNLLEGVIAEESVVYGRVYEAKGRLLAEVYRDGEEYHREQKATESQSVDPFPLEPIIRNLNLNTPNGTKEYYKIMAPVLLRKTMTPGIDEDLAQTFGLEQGQQGIVPIGFVEIGISPAQMYRRLSSLIWFNVAMTLGVVGLGILLSGVFVQRLLLPVKGMILTAQEIAHGNLYQRVRVLSGDEIGELARIFNQMAQSLLERDEQLRRQYGDLKTSHASLSRVAAELEEYKQELERKVQERTQELAQKNVLFQAAMEQAQESDRLKTQFLANMSHELRTPLNAIIGFSQVMLEGIDGEISEIQRKDLTAIYNSGMHLLGLINDILDIAKIEAGRMELNLEMINLGEVIQSVMATSKALLKGKEIELKMEVAEGLPILRADKIRIRQIILNLVGNAAKFTTKGFISISAVEDHNTVKISVTDTGLGIREKDIPRLFKEFGQLDASTTRNYGGTGLGLALVKRFVEMHGGRVWAESNFGVGSTFSFVLPLQQPTRPEPQEHSPIPIERPSDSPAKVDGPLVAVIEDDPLAISLFDRYLSSENYRVVGVIPDDHVLDQIKALRPQTILLDILMGPRDGWAILHELKADADTKHIPVIMCSILQKDKKGYALGAVDYLVKPVDKGELLQALARLGTIYDVAVIDDDPKAVRILENVLSDQKYRVHSAYDGASGLAMIREKRPDMVLLDLMMPGMDGFEVVEAVKKDPEICHIPIVILTAKDLTGADRERLNGKVSTLIQKSTVSEIQLMTDVAKTVKHLESQFREEI
ncbi:MAG TPA: response regulator [Nitrospiria bacterium]|nr:response regulator [Nitrospiria bacterium]